ncbi:MAG TPA: ATP-dependent DNA helicase RecQ, partial [Bacteroidetes bacterium]|nr:ATP-dependent DNA helicase RecQ [Bacteroidota bacterium]
DWQQFILQLLNQGLLEIAYDEANTLKVTPQGRQVLFEGRKVELVRPSHKPKSQAKAKPPKTKKEQVDDALFERLRKLRKRLADKQGVPPYIVFGDRTLKEISGEKPTNEIQMRKISGIGDKKWQMYGDLFINEVLQFIQDNYKAVSRSIKGSSEIATYELFRQKKSPEAIAKARSLSVTTIYSHLAKLYASGEYEIDIFQFLSTEELQQILEAAIATGAGVAKPIFDHLGGKIPYFKIHFALAYRERLLTLDNK